MAKLVIGEVELEGVTVYPHRPSGVKDGEALERKPRLGEVA